MSLETAEISSNISIENNLENKNKMYIEQIKKSDAESNENCLGNKKSKTKIANKSISKVKKILES